ncbi:MAG: cytochrome c3 family protein [Holophagales bacterium]|nr:MAG: cytochrome c3 family protein [Holophagales bacterium]
MNGRSKPVRIVALLVALAATGALAYALSNARQGYEPRQPILFRHTRMAGPPVWQTDAKGEKVNVGGFGIPCLYCHTMPYKGRHATVPSTAVCMNCHSTVGLSREWVLKLRAYWDRGEPIPWVKVHDLPDFVYYDHSAHLNARDESGKLKLPTIDAEGRPINVCENCHGKVEQEEIVRVQTPFNMQWCLDCHRKPEMKAPTTCVTCHR